MKLIMIVKFEDKELKRIEELKKENYEGTLISSKDIGKDRSISFEITDPIKAECFIMNLMRPDFNIEDLGIRIKSYNFHGNISDIREELREELLKVIQKHLG